MILPDFVLPSRVNQTWLYSGMDSIEYCKDKKHFETYPHQISYQYNSRGFRDAEWPDDLAELKSAVWCVGDSFTVGLGSPVEHTWPYQVGKQLGQRTINVSMDGASNNWIARKTLDIIANIAPDIMVIQWSYITRREKTVHDALEDSWQGFYRDIRDSSWPSCSHDNIELLPNKILHEINTVHGGWKPLANDEMRRLQSINCSDTDDIDNTVQCIESTNTASHTKIVHSFIPDFVPHVMRGRVESQSTGMTIPMIQRVDVARDGHHYDVLTAEKFSIVVRDLLANGRS